MSVEVARSISHLKQHAYGKEFCRVFEEYVPIEKAATYMIRQKGSLRDYKDYLEECEKAAERHGQ